MNNDIPQSIRGFQKPKFIDFKQQSIERQNAVNNAINRRPNDSLSDQLKAANIIYQLVSEDILPVNTGDY